MPGKRTETTVHATSAKKIRKAITLDVKLDVLRRLEAGQKINEIGKALGLAASTVCTIKNNQDKIRNSLQRVTSLTAKNVSKQRSAVMEEMERMLSVWIDHQSQQNIAISTTIIQEKARNLHQYLITKNGEGSKTEQFLASKGWFDRFKKRHSLHNIKMSGEAASADVEAAKNYPATFKKIIEAGGYTPQQVYNVDETGLFWKRMPSRTFISKQEKSASGFKAAKDRITILFGGNAAGDNKLKPMLIYHAENPRAFKGCNKSELGVIWRSNKKGWMTANLFEDWLNNFFASSVRKFNSEQNISNKALLIIDNAPSHKLTLIPDNIKVVFLPPNTTPILQPMDQGVIANFKAYYLRRVFKNLIKYVDGPNRTTITEFWKQFNIFNAIDNIIKSWDEVKETAMNGVWKKLWPECTNDFGSSLQNIQEIQNEIVAMAHEVGMDEVGNEDVAEVLGSGQEDVSNEELIAMLEGSTDAENAGSLTHCESSRILTSQKMSKAFSLIQEAIDIFSENDPSAERSLKVSREIENSILCYRQLYKDKNKCAKQTSLVSYFSKKKCCSS